MTLSPLLLKAPAQHLRQLILIRAGLILLLALAVITSAASDFARLPLAPILTVLGALTLLNAVSLMRVLWGAGIGQREIFWQLAADIVAVGLLAYFTGGATNPFLSYLLVPICIAAAILPSYLTWPLSLSGIGMYGLLLWHYQPLVLLAPPVHIHGAQNLDTGAHLHVVGMWLNFALSALLICFFVARMAATLRRQQEDLNARREEDLRNEQLLAIATQAAGTAHALGTPLSTIKTLIHELSRQPALEAAWGPELKILQQQVGVCGETLAELRHQADWEQLTHPQTTEALSYCRHIIEYWQLLRPDARAEIKLDSKLAAVKVRLHPTVQQAVINVLDNAADAGDEGITVDVSHDQHHLHWLIADRGTGMTRDTHAALGQRPLTTKPEGLGLGLFLTHATLERYGGRVEHRPRPGGGTCTDLALPLETSE